MYGAPRASLVGDGPCIDAVASALSSSDCIVDRVSADGVNDWLSRVRAGRHEDPLPNLIIIDDATALAHGGAPLDVLTSRAPWRLLPVVVLAEREEPAALRAAYTAGAASVVVFDDDERAEMARAFARYWIGTALLPDTTALS